MIHLALIVLIAGIVGLIAGLGFDQVVLFISGFILIALGFVGIVLYFPDAPECPNYGEVKVLIDDETIICIPWEDAVWFQQFEPINKE